jgi:RNA polymerase sigma factor (sigma-70 family)
MGTVIDGVARRGASAGNELMDHGAGRDRRLADLMRSAQDGDHSAYIQLLEEVTPLLRQTVRRYRHFLQPADVEDLVQDILLSLHAVRATYDPGRPFLPWLRAIARNRMADGARRYVRRSANEVAVEHLPVTFAEDGANVPGDAHDDPEALRQAMRRLPRGQREAIEMLKLREMSLREAAATTGLSIAALKVAVHRGVEALRKALVAEI